MASSSRFPHLTLPFAIIGAAAGWLSVSLLSNPLLKMLRPGRQPAGALIAMVLAAIAGTLLTRWCVGKRYAYQMDSPHPDARPPTDTWGRHITAVLLAGTLTGAGISLVYQTWRGPFVGAFSGFVCALAFVPVCVAVIVMARRAQRARLGSLVSDSDRRAVWAILATTLAVATLEALPDWPAALAGDIMAPFPALGMVLAAAVAVGALLLADRRAIRRAQRSMDSGVTHHDADAQLWTDRAVPHLDLGLGDDRWAQLARSNTAYRGRDRTLALIQGSPEQALAALRRAVQRGALCLAAIGAVAALHGVAGTAFGLRQYSESRCAMDDSAACRRAGDFAMYDDLHEAIGYYGQACEGSDAAACLTLARMFEAASLDNRVLYTDPEWDTPKLADFFRKRACDTGDFASCRHGRPIYSRR